MYFRNFQEDNETFIINLKGILSIYLMVSIVCKEQIKNECKYINTLSNYYIDLKQHKRYKIINIDVFLFNTLSQKMK